MARVQMTVGRTSALSAMAIVTWFSLQQASAQGFADDFTGEELAKAWTVINPDRGKFRVRDGSLLVQVGKVAKSGDNALPNLFTIDTKLPDGNWIMSIRFSADFKTARESLVFGLWDSADKFVLADIHSGGDSDRGWQLNAEISKRSGKSQAKFTQAVAQLRCNICRKDQTFGKFASTLAMPIDAQIRKSGKEYTLNVRMGGDEGTWRKIATVISINPPVRPVMFARQRAETKGQSAFRIDHFRIDAAK